MNAIKTDARYGVDMTDRLAAYDAAQRSAREAYEVARRRAWEAYEVARRPAWEAYEVARRPAWEAYEAAERSARGALACGDPLVDWIIDNTSGYRGEPLQVLRALPATLAELDALADDAGWCEEWDALRAAAIRDGVIA
jgi:hypothetical protein